MNSTLLLLTPSEKTFFVPACTLLPLVHPWQVAVANDTRFFIVHWCSPRLKDLLDLVLRNEAYHKSVEKGRRPVVALTNLVWSSCSKSNNTARGLTSYSSSAYPSFNSHVVWVGDYEDMVNEKQDVSFSLTESQAASKRPAAAYASKSSGSRKRTRAGQ